MHSFKANSESLHVYIFINKEIKCYRGCIMRYKFSKSGLGLECLTPQYFSYIMEVRFIGGARHRSTRKNTDLSQLPYDHDSLLNQK